MGNQRKKLLFILKTFQCLEFRELNKRERAANIELIKDCFYTSLNKRDLTRRILFDALLSDDDILKLLRIIIDKEK